MRLRPYRTSDFEAIKEWVGSERIHAAWCANLLPYPLRLPAFQSKQEEYERAYNQSAFTVLKDDGTPVGYFNISFQVEDNSGYLKFIILDNRERGKGLGREMVELIERYAFECAGLKTLKLSVFDNNKAAVRLYQSAGFVETKHDRNVFRFGDEWWGKYLMSVDR